MALQHFRTKREREKKRARERETEWVIYRYSNSQNNSVTSFDGKIISTSSRRQAFDAESTSTCSCQQSWGPQWASTHTLTHLFIYWVPGDAKIFVVMLSGQFQLIQLLHATK